MKIKDHWLVVNNDQEILGVGLDEQGAWSDAESHSGWKQADLEKQGCVCVECRVTKKRKASE